MCQLAQGIPRSSARIVFLPSVRYPTLTLMHPTPLAYLPSAADWPSAAAGEAAGSRFCSTEMITKAYRFHLISNCSLREQSYSSKRM